MDEIVEDTVTITRDEYEKLLEDSDWLRCLEEAGVDNWEGIDWARSLKTKLNLKTKLKRMK